MEKHFCNYNQSLALKELGFDEPCLMYIDDEEDLINDDTAEWIGAVKAPLKSQVFEWFEDNYDNAVTIRTYKMSNGVRWYDYSVNEFGGRSKSKEEAELACIDKLIKIVKDES